MYQPQQRVIRLRATQANHQWAMEMMNERQIHHRDGRKWIVIQETLNQHGLHVTIQELIVLNFTKNTETKTMTTEIEKTKRALYGCLDRIRRAAKHRALTAEFEERLEEHLESLRREAEVQQAKRQDALDSGFAAFDRLRQMTEERDQIQQRVHAIDHAYCEQSNRAGAQAREIERLNELNRIVGEELIRVQGAARENLDDMRTAEKLSEELSDKLTHATTVIGQQEQLIVGQRSAIADMHAELTHSRVIRKAFKRAQAAFSTLDAALHESAPYKAQKALGDDVVDAE